MIAQINFKEPLHELEHISAEPSTSMEEEPGIDERILCRNCYEYIAEKDDEIRVNDSDYHLFKNPAGIYFRIVCFRNARGCTIITDYTGEYTWFDGFNWAVALCRKCHAHLGWHYVSDDSMFFGLIADRLTGI